MAREFAQSEKTACRIGVEFVKIASILPGLPVSLSIPILPFIEGLLVASDNVDPPVAQKVSTNHPIGFWFFFWGEFAERCSYYGMRAILALYMVDRLGVAKSDAATYMSLFIAACYFFPLVGGFLADNFFGKYWTIVGFSVPYVFAQFIVGIQDKYIIFGALALLAMGSGVIKPNISTLMGMTYDKFRPGQEQLRTSAFSYFYMAINIGAALSQFSMPWLRTKYDYHVAFIFPAVLMAVALVIFALGKRFYANEKLVRKIVGNEEDLPNDGKTITGLPITYVAITKKQAAEERALKWQTLGRIGSVFLMVMFFWAIFDQSASTWIFFADTYMDTTLIGERTDGTAMMMSGAEAEKTFGFPTVRMSPDAIQAFNPVFIVLFVPVFVWLFKALNRAGFKIQATHKMTIGFILTGSTMLVMAFAASLAGPKQDAIKLTTKEGEVILPMSNTKLDEVTPTAGSANATTDVAFGDAVTLNAGDWTYDKEKKKVNLTNGTFKLADGKTLTVANGRIDFAKSNVHGEGAVQTPGALELKLKPGTYANGSGTLVVKDLNRAEAKPEPLPPPDVEEKEPPKATLEVVEWVKPSERVTMWWKVFAFLIITMGEILISVTGLELAFVAAPPSMKSFITGCWLAVVFLANLLINAPVTRVYQIPGVTPQAYFLMLAAAMVVVVLIFILIGMSFNKAMAKKAREEEAEKARLNTAEPQDQ